MHAMRLVPTYGPGERDFRPYAAWPAPGSLDVSARRERELDRTNGRGDRTRGGTAEKPAAEKLADDPQDLIRVMPAEGDRPAGILMTEHERARRAGGGVTMSTARRIAELYEVKMNAALDRAAGPAVLRHHHRRVAALDASPIHLKPGRKPLPCW